MAPVTESQYACTIDDELVRLALLGDNEACLEIRHRYHNRLCLTAMAMLNSSEKSNMAVEHTWKMAWKELHEYKGESLFLTWICRWLIAYIVNNFLQNDNEAAGSGS